MAKIVTVTLDGPVPKGGWVILNYSDPSGGRTNIGAKINIDEKTGRVDSWDDVAQSFVNSMKGRPWPSFLKAVASKNRVRISGPDELNKAVFFAEFNPDPDQKARHQLHPSFVKIEDEVF